MTLPPPRPIHSASVLMPTYQGMEFLERLLDALAAQVAPFPWDVHVIDSGSTDGTLECLQARAAEFPVPFRVAAIPPAEFDHGDTRNQLAARSGGDLLVFLTQDAIPSNPDWLRLLARNFDDPTVGGAYSRNVSRHDAKLLTRVFTRTDPGYETERVVTRKPDAATWARMSNEERRFFYNFNDVASAVRRELWERHPFPRTTMGEDVLLGRGLLEAGWAVVFDAESTVDHSHDYGPEKMRWRGNVDGKFNAEWMDRICVATKHDMDVLIERQVAQDVLDLEALGKTPDEVAALREEALELRGAMALGLWEGGLSPRRYPRSRMRDRADLRVLTIVPASTARHVLHEVAAYACVAEALVRRGHRVTVLDLTDLGGDEPLELDREEVRGVAVVRARGAARGDALTALQESLVLSERPDLVHFLGLDEPTAALFEPGGRRGPPHQPRRGWSRPGGDPAHPAGGADRGRPPAAGGVSGFGWLDGRASEIAPRLLGATVTCGKRAGTIVEVEAYEGEDDPASHAYRGPTDRSQVMFGRAGLLYVYRSYGVHWCANVVCGPEGRGSALLIRAVEPTVGVEQMWADRPKARRATDLASGPGKLCAALGIDGSHYGVDLLDPSSPVRLGEGPGLGGAEVSCGPRVGISKAVERPWRFALVDHPHVSRPRP